MIEALTKLQNPTDNPRSITQVDEGGNRASMQMEDFLQLLTSQISNQDPLEPMKDTEFISQMANIASLEQMQQFSKGFEAFASSHKDMVTQAYLGRMVSISTEHGGQTDGMVDSVEKNTDGQVTVIVGGKAYDPNNITKVSLADK